MMSRSSVQDFALSVAWSSIGSSQQSAGSTHSAPQILLVGETPVSDGEQTPIVPTMVLVGRHARPSSQSDDTRQVSPMPPPISGMLPPPPSPVAPIAQRLLKQPRPS